MTRSRSIETQKTAAIEANRALEQEAGIAAECEKGRQGSFIPLGALGDPCTPDQFFADEHDHARDRIRRAYFSVTDLELRQRLIASNRLIDTFFDEERLNEVSTARRQVDIAMGGMDKLPWITSTVLAAGVVFLGNWIYGLIGAIAGAVVGIFFGLANLHRIYVANKAVVAHAMNALAEHEKSSQEDHRFPVFFTEQEQHSGELDRDFDRKSAYSEVMKSSCL